MGVLYLWHHWDYLVNWLDSLFQKFSSWDALDRSKRTWIHRVRLRPGLFKPIIFVVFGNNFKAHESWPILIKIHLKIQKLILKKYPGVQFWHQAGIHRPLGPPSWILRPWDSYLGSFWATNASGFAASITEFTVIEMAPEYMKDVQGFDLLGSGALASLPFVINLIIVFIACIGLDYLLHKVRDSWTEKWSRNDPKDQNLWNFTCSGP